MIDIKTQYAGLTLRNPIIVGSSGLTNKAERNRDFEKAGAGAIVLKSLFEEQIEMQSEALMQDSDYPEAADYIRGYVKANQVNDYLELIKKSKELCTIPIIASINCYKADAWIDFARQIELAGADALELNVFFMETELTEDFESIRDTYVSIIRKVKEESGLANLKVVATGGLGRAIADETDSIDIYDSSLTLDGLRIIYDKNRK